VTVVGRERKGALNAVLVSSQSSGRTPAREHGVNPAMLLRGAVREAELPLGLKEFLSCNQQTDSFENGCTSW